MRSFRVNFAIAHSLFVAAFFLLPALPVAGTINEEKKPDALQEAKSAMRAAKYNDAIRLIDLALTNKIENADEAWYLKALAHYYLKQHDESTKASTKVISDFGNSAWFRKARFLKARALVAERKFKEAEIIYEAEAERLLSSTRKHEIASVIIKFAEALSKKPGPNELDLPPPDFNKAYKLYGQVLAMEIGRELRDKVMFQQARAIFHAGNYAASIQRFRAYLNEFDPDWTGNVGSVTRMSNRKRENPKSAGKHILQARFHLVESQVKANQKHIARVNAEDLLKMLKVKGGDDAKKLEPSTAWLLVQTYSMPNPPLASLEKAVSTARNFAKDYPGHPRSVQAAWLIPTSYANHRRSDKAIAEFEKFIKGDGFSLPKGDQAIAKLDDLKLSPAELRDQWQKLALFQIGQIRYGQKQYDQSIEIFKRYINRFPNGPNWSKCQRRIVDARYFSALELVTQKKNEQARTKFEDFLTKHPLDARAPQILFLFGQMEFVKAEDLEMAKADSKKVNAAYRKAIDRWQRLVSKYPGTQQSSLALYRIAMIYEEKLGELDNALQAYRRLTWGNSASNARLRVAKMTEKHLTVTTERKYRSNESASIKLSTRNIKKLKVKQYFLDLEAYFRKTHSVGKVDGLDIDLIQPDKTWEVKIDAYSKYTPIEQTVEIPFGDRKSGVCLINVSTDDLQATTLVIRSDIDVIVKSSRREVLVFAQDMLAGKPADEVNLLLSDGKTVFATGKTNEDGIFRGEFGELKTSNDVRVFAVKDGSVASNLLNLAGLKFSSGLTPKGYIYTDRPAYQPGQTVKLRGIIRDVVDDVYIAPKDQIYNLQISDTAGRVLWAQPVTLSEFGSFQTEFPLNDRATLGRYTIAVSKPNCGTYSSYFDVQKFKLEKLKLQIETDQKVYFRGEKVKLTAQAKYYWGQPAAKKSIRYSLPDGRALVEKTDDEGKLEFEFDTTGMLSGTHLNFHVAIEGENVSANHGVMLATQGFGIKVKPNRRLVLSGEPLDVEIETKTPDGKPIERELTLTVLRRSVAKANRVTDGVPWIQKSSRPAEEKTLIERKIKTDKKTGKVTINLDDKALKDGGQYIVRVSGEDRFKQVVSGQAVYYVSSDEDMTKLRFFARSETLQVGRKADLRLHSRIDAKLALVTIEGESIIGHRILPLKKGYNTISLDIDHQHFPNFRVAVSIMDDRTLRAAHKDFRVERQLNVVVKPLAESYRPGQVGKVQLKITDQLGNPVRGELSLSLVDEALFAIYSDSTPSILQFFQHDAWRHAEFRLGSSCGFSYTATTRQVLKEYTAELARLELQSAEALEIKKLEKELKLQSEVRNIYRIQKELTALKLRQNRFGKADKRADFQGFVEVPQMPGSFGDNLNDAEKKLLPPQAGGGAGAAIGGGGFGPADRKSRDKSKKAGKDSAPPRKELPEAGWWNGSIITNDKGEAEVEIPMPDTTTQWRLTARGVTVKTLVGESKANVITRKDFFVTFKTPRQLMEGDSLNLIVRSHNLTDYEGDVKLKLTYFGGEKFENKLAERSLDTKITKNGVVESIFDSVKIPGISRVKIQIDAMAGELSDSLAITVPVRPWGLEFAAQTGGTSKGDATATLSLPPGREYATRWMTISVGANLQRSIIDMAIRRAHRNPEKYASRCVFPPPHGWGRSPGSDLLAVVSALEYAQKVEAPIADIIELKQRARSLVSTLVVSQRGDGAWTWRGHNNYTDWAATATSFWALCDAKKLGIAVNDAAFAKAQTYLKNRFTSVNQNDNDAKSVILHALSCNNAADFAHVNRIHRERNRLSATALGYSALAFINLKRSDFAKELIDLLETKHEKLDSRTVWMGSKNHPWMNEQVETTAVAALALMKARPASSKIEQAIKYLLHRRGAWGFSPAKAHGPALAALCYYYREGKFAANDYELEIKVNGKDFTTITSKKSQANLLLSVPKELLSDGKNNVTFNVKGRGEFAYAVSMRGFSKDIKDPKSWSHPYVRGRAYRHAQLEYAGKPIGVNSSSPVKNIAIGQRIHVDVNLNESYNRQQFMVVEEHIPAGFILAEGSLRGSYQHVVIDGDRITMYYRAGQNVRDFSYDLIGYATGTFRILPTTIRDQFKPQSMRIGQATELTVLKPGEQSKDPYVMNDSERYKLGQLNFNDGNYKQAKEYLTHLYKKQRRYNEREIARMLLWIYTAKGFYDSQQIVDVFEILRERHPSLEIPYDKILKVGQAYRDIGEFERAYQIFRATIDASFVNDSYVSAVLEDEGQFLGSIDFQENLWREYPDTAQVVSSYFAISQALYQKAPHAATLAKQQRQIAINRGEEPPKSAPDRIAMLKETIRLLSEFMTLYPDRPLADDAAFSMANALLDLKQYETVVEACERFYDRFDKSDFRSGFQYMTALGHFWQRDYEAALTSAKSVAEGKSKDRDFARYIIGQIYHAENKPKDAIEWYTKVAKLYADAKQAISYFEAKHVSLKEVNIFRPGKPVEVELSYRNIKDARCQVYKVDLMRLYLREKNLSNVTKVNLAGIKPLLTTTVKLGDGKDYVDQKRKIKLNLKEEGAYLIICRGDNLFSSALALITPLKIEVQEDATSGRVRANVIDVSTKNYVPEVHIKAIGSADKTFKSGDTDLRGIFVAENLRGKATVIARVGDARYAFYRGTDWLGRHQIQTRVETPKFSAPSPSKLDYQQNLRMQNDLIQEGNYKQFDQFRRGQNKGVEVKNAK